MSTKTDEIECLEEKSIRQAIARKNYAGNWQAVSQEYEKLYLHRKTCIFCQGVAANVLFGQKVTVVP